MVVGKSHKLRRDKLLTEVKIKCEKAKLFRKAIRDPDELKQLFDDCSINEL